MIFKEILKLKYIAIGNNGELWGVNSSDDIFHCSGDSNWQQIAGKLKQISVGANGEVWGVDSCNKLFHYTGHNHWEKIKEGDLKQISVGANGEVWGVHPSDAIFCYYSGNNTWQRIEGGLKQISVGVNGEIWGVNSSDDIYRYSGNNIWQQIAGKLKQISVGANGEVWGVDFADDIFRYVGNNNWEPVIVNNAETKINNLEKTIDQLKNQISQDKVEIEKQNRQAIDRVKKIQVLQKEINDGDQKITQLEVELKKFRREAELNDKIEKLMKDSQLTLSQANDLLLKAAELNNVNVAKYALDHGADKDTCDKAFHLTKEPRIKIMLFATYERKQGVDNVQQTITVQSDITFDPEKDKYLISHWPLKGNPIDEKHLNTGKMHDADVVADRFNKPESSSHFGGKEYIIGDAKHFPKGNRAISLWFKADKTTDGKIAGGTLFSYCGEDVSNNLAIVVNHDLDYASEKSGNLCAYDFGKPEKSIKYAANTEDNFDEWNHLVITSDIGEGTDIYLNGICVAHRNICFNCENLEKSIQTFGIGAFVYEGQPVANPIDPMFKGSINDVMVYSRGLSAEEVSALYQAQLRKSVPSVNAEKWIQENAPDIYKKFIQSSSTLFQAKPPQNDPKVSEGATAEKEPKSDMQYSV